jgi:hypothetical protein
MCVEASEESTAAERELEVGLKEMREAISRVPEEERGALAPVHEALQTLDDSMAKQNREQFVRSLVGLARAVLEVRQRTPRGPLAEIPVPPYDLWLPFKAGALRLSDASSSSFYQRVPVINVRVRSETSCILELLGQPSEVVKGPAS